MDYPTLLYDPIYDIFGVEAKITPGVGGSPFTVTALDKTAGIAVGSGVDIQTIEPAACVRVYELTANDISRLDLDNGTIEINNVTWRIDATLPRPSPSGEAIGELFLILGNQNDR